MDNTQQFKPGPGTIPLSALYIEKVHSCADCPIRQKAIAEPQSVFAQIHNWHKTWWPGWKAQQARECPLNAGTRAHVDNEKIPA